MFLGTNSQATCCPQATAAHQPKQSSLGISIHFISQTLPSQLHFTSFQASPFNPNPSRKKQNPNRLLSIFSITLQFSFNFYPFSSILFVRMDNENDLVQKLHLIRAIKSEKG